MKKLALVLIVLLFVLAIFSSTNYGSTKADEGAIEETASNIIPVNSSQIELEKEDLKITLTDNWTAYVDAVFIMKNTGEKVNQKMGFPSEQPAEIPSSFKVFVNGKELPLSNVEEKVSGSNVWEISTIPFNKGEEKTIRVTYVVEHLYGYSFNYILKTGATWKGSIGSLDITITLPGKATPPFLLKALPSGYTVKGNDIIYHLKNYEPDQNIVVDFLPDYFYKKITSLKETAEKTGAPKDWYTYIKALLPVDIVGPYGSRTPHRYFVNEYRTDGYEEFVQKELTEAMKKCKGTTYEKILQIAEAARFNKQNTFYGGVYGMKDFTQIERAFGTSLEKPETKEVGRIVAYYYWWKANALGDMNKYEGFDALVRFIKLAPRYIPFGECENMQNPEVVGCTPFPPSKYAIFEEFVYPEKVVIQTKNGRVYAVKFYFKNSMEKGLSQLRDFQRHLKYEADKILQNGSDIQFDFNNLYSGEIVATYAVPFGKLDALKQTVDKIPEVVGTKDSPFYVYPNALITLLRQGSVPKEWDISSIRNNIVAQLSKTEAEIKEGAKNPYWEKMKGDDDYDSSNYENTYKATISLPLEYIENNKYFLEKVPDKVAIEVEQNSEVAQSPDEKTQNPVSNSAQQKAGKVVMWIAIISAVVLFLLYEKDRL